MKIGAIFDWDGVVIDSSLYHEKSWDLLAAEEGLPLPPGHFQKGFGMRNELIIPTILNWTNNRNEIQRLSQRKEVIYREIMTAQGISSLPGVVEFLEVLRDLKIPCAVGSSSHRLNIQIVMEQLKIGDYFDGIVSSEDVSIGKPDPQVFCLAAQLIQCMPSYCVVFEDAPAGIAAAHNAGMKAVGIASTRSAHVLKDADIVVQSFNDIDFMMIKELFSSVNGNAG